MAVLAHACWLRSHGLCQCGTLKSASQDADLSSVLSDQQADQHQSLHDYFLHEDLSPVLCAGVQRTPGHQGVAE